MNEIYHYGIPRRSGRYPWGSGDRPYQSEKNQIEKKQKVLNAFGYNINAKKLVSKNQIDPNKPLIKKKGETVQHITGVDMTKLKPGQLYVTATDYDNKLYELFLSSMLKVKGFDPKKVELTLKNDLKTPSSNDQKRIFSNVLKDNRKNIIDEMTEWLVKKGKVKNIEAGKNALAQKSNDQLYQDFINFLEIPSESKNMFYSNLKKSGYNSVLDEHDRFSWIGGRQPIILMEAMDVVGDLKISDIGDIGKILDQWLKMNS